jgi:Uma2 family endonuclease
MVAATLISVDEHLSTAYRPDFDLVDGHILERNVGEYDHGILQITLGAWFLRHRREWNIRAVTELRVRVKPSRFRVPDIAVLSDDRPVEQIATHPPVICIDILAKDDTLRRLQDRIDDYLAFGVPNIWVLDPASRRAYVCDRYGLREPADGVLEVPNSPIRIVLAELFADLD